MTSELLDGFRISHIKGRIYYGFAYENWIGYHFQFRLKIGQIVVVPEFRQFLD